ncbi:DMT family transporter [Pseudoalteromonas rubra]|uniref:EamA domain-containing protein n=1 Tax=Pseudoalteromonas rubra TaxID=43658 RepID=A0A0U3I1Q3_9GAMM|nr:DMT family transporter [Pseudoalteromonas rubra]ALU41727.1 hypothetical protein AT705_01570 [Pseudoalteromonas rubra]
MNTHILFALSLVLTVQILSTLGTVIIKYMGTEVAFFQLILYRQLASSLLVIPFLYKMFGALKPPAHKRIHLLRGVLIAIGNITFMIAIVNLPLLTVTAIVYLSPIFLVIMSHFVIKEQYTFQKLMSALAGFIGILIITNPSQINIYGFVALLTALALALNNACMKYVAHKEHPLETLFWSNLYTIILMIPLCLWEGTPVSAHLVFNGGALGVLYVVMTYLIIKAYQMCDASLLAPAEYTGLVFASITGYVLFFEPTSPVAAVGIVLIILSVLAPARLRSSSVKQVNQLPSNPTPENDTNKL